MKKAGLAVFLVSVFALAQKIKPDGVIRTTNYHLVDLSSCDKVVIDAPVSELHVTSGEYHAYWFKKYADISRLKITCEMEGR